MRNRLKKIDDLELKAIFKDSNLIDQTSKETDDKIINLIYSYKEPERKKISFAEFFSIKQVRYSFALAVMLLILIPTGLFLFNKLSSGFYDNKITYFNNVSGQVDIVRNGSVINILKGDKVRINDLIKTDIGSVGSIQIGNNIYIKLNERSEIKFNSIHTESDSTSINLSNGELLVSIDKKIKKDFQINTEYAGFKVAGTKFKIKNNPGEFTYLAVIQGMIEVIPKFDVKSDKIIVKQDQEIKITEDNYKIDNIKDTEKENIKNQIEKKTDDIEHDEKKEKWETKKIFIDSQTDSELKNILGFTSYGNYVIAQSEISTICFDVSGKKLWENKWGDEQGIFFMSVPVIHKNKIFISSLNKKLVVLDLKTGKKLSIIDSPGNITFGYKPVYYNDILYFPYGNGICFFDINENKFTGKIIYNNPTSPVIHNNKLYITSFIDKSISCFSLNGEQIWNKKLLFRSFNSISVLNDMILIGDNFGNIYNYSLDGKMIKKIKISSGIISSIKKFNEHYYVIANNGWLYKFNFNSSKPDKLIEVDINPESTNYLFKNLEILGERVFTGTNKGHLIIYDLIDNNVIINRKISEYAVTSTVYNAGESSFVGTDAGEIFSLNKIK